jgi:hypothetical protein
VNTASAAISKIRCADVICRARISSENAIVATPLGPNQPMNAFALTLSPVPISDTNSAAGRATSSVTATIATAAHPSLNRLPNVNSDPNTTKIPSLTISISSSERCSKLSRISGRAIPSTIAHTNTAIRPLPRGSATAIP